MKCDELKTVIPIPKSQYKCYLSGVLYRVGSLEHMSKLFNEYVLHRKMYEKSSCNFKIEELK